MKNLSYFLIFISIVFIQSCSGDKPDVIKTKSGLYGSKAGEFLIKFPQKPNVLVQENMMNGQKFNVNTFIYAMGKDQRYSVNYVDYPEDILKLIDVDGYFDQIAKGIDGSTQLLTIGSRVEGKNDGFDKSVTYKLHSPQDHLHAHFTIKLIKHGNRFYTLSYIAYRNRASNDVIDEFINSFRIYKPKVP